jgi:hypothetical protein
MAIATIKSKITTTKMFEDTKGSITEALNERQTI